MLKWIDLWYNHSIQKPIEVERMLFVDQEKIKETVQRKLIGGIASMRDLKEEASTAWKQFLREGVDLFAKDRVPNEELHYNKETAEKVKTQPEKAVEEEDTILKTLCGYSDEELALLKEKLAEVERIRGEENGKTHS